MTTSLREQLAAKTRRRVVVPIMLTDDTEDREIVRGAEIALGLARQRGDEQTTVALLESAVEDANAAVMAHYAQVELQSLDPGEWDAAQQQWCTDGEWNWAEALAPLLAQSCTDPELRDLDYWVEALARPAWAEADRSALRTGLLHVNLYRPDPFVPKG